MSIYADILLPLNQPTYTFAVEENMQLEEGMAVAVPFGVKGDKFYTGIVWRLHTTPPQRGNLKRVSSLLYDGQIVVDQPHRKLWEWIAEYYLCSLGEVMRIALPSLLKPSAMGEEGFNDSIFQPRTERYIKLLLAGEELNRELDRAERRAPKQYHALLQIASLAERTGGEIIPRRLLDCDSPTLTALQKRGTIELSLSERRAERLSQSMAFQLPILSQAQTWALEQIEKGLTDKSVALLSGVTGSGKTEIYIHLIARRLSRGEDVLMLVPEIALTSQLVERLERIFSSRVTTYHSKLTPQRRTDTYLRLSRSQGGEFVIGARSALFLPLNSLGLIVVDEEHDASYKQSDSAPRYNARDCAVAATKLLGCRTVLGSATPSLESRMNAHSGKYAYSTLSRRYGDSLPPEIIISDTLRAVRRWERKSHFNLELRERIKSTLERGEQVMLFQNRRGFSLYINCPQCNWRPTCPHCNVSLTLHKGVQRMVCHYCGYNIQIPDLCPECGSQDLQGAGFGTEKVVEEISRLYPEARVLRMDRDAVSSESSFRRVISTFERGDADILVGTQMITKGLDFGNVTLVGVLNADNLLLNADFRASERAFQLLTQVAGRSGRRSRRGEVVIQTSDPRNPIITQVAHGDYEAMAREQLSERMAFCYPPYSHLIKFILRHNCREELHSAARQFADSLRARFGRRLLGPVAPLVDKVRDEYIVELMLKIESSASMRRAREVVVEVVDEFKTSHKRLTLIIDVDPQ